MMKTSTALWATEDLQLAKATDLYSSLKPNVAGKAAG